MRKLGLILAVLLSALLVAQPSLAMGVGDGHIIADATKGVPTSEQPGIINASQPNGKPAYVFEKYSSCIGLEPGTRTPATCTAMNAKCDAKPNGELVDWHYRSAEPGSTMKLFQAGVCWYPGDPTDTPGRRAPAFTITEFRRLPLKAAAITTQPGRHTLKGAYTNIYAVVDDQEFAPILAGQAIRVRAHPTEFRWSYGDGTSRTLAFQGGPLLPGEAELDTETRSSHIYQNTGDFNVSVTTVYVGEYSVNGGPWVPIAGTATVQTPSKVISVWRTVTNLYADNCLENPRGAGCPAGK